jgi:hypothetical protein
MKSKRAAYTSKGERHSTALSILSSIRRDMSVADKWLTKQAAWLKGQNPWLSVDNPNSNETNKKMILVRSNDYWGSPHQKQKAEK